jgi:hypothetical protein
MSQKNFVYANLNPKAILQQLIWPSGKAFVLYKPFRSKPRRKMLTLSKEQTITGSTPVISIFFVISSISCSYLCSATVVFDFQC